MGVNGDLKIIKRGALVAPLFFSGALLILALLFCLNRDGSQSPMGQRISFIFHQAPPKHLKHISFGFHEMLADFLWLKYLQEADYCRHDEAKACQKGWGYQMILSMHELAPRFRIPLAIGPLNLDIINNDLEGAEALFDLAVKAFPNDWPILYRAAYFFLYDGNDNEKAAGYLQRASQIEGAPWWLSSLAARLYEKGGKLELALKILEDYRETLTDPEQRKKVDERIRTLQSRVSH